MDFRNALSRAIRGMTEDLRLHALTVLSLIVAFLCLGAAVLGIENLSRMGARWNQARNLTVYLRDNSNPDDVAQLRLLLETLPEVASLNLVSAQEAQTDFLEHVGHDLAWKALPASTFPASFEVELKRNVPEARLAHLASRIGRFSAAEDVETYRDWFGQREMVMRVGRTATGLLAALVAVCAIAVIGHAIRLSVNSRRDEIQVLRLCGATNHYVHSPFLIEGAFHGLAACAVSLLLLLVCFLSIKAHINDTVLPLVGIKVAFLTPLTTASMLFFAGLVGGLGSALAVRRSIEV